MSHIIQVFIKTSPNVGITISIVAELWTIMHRDYAKTINIMDLNNFAEIIFDKINKSIFDTNSICIGIMQKSYTSQI